MPELEDEQLARMIQTPRKKDRSPARKKLGRSSPGKSGESSVTQLENELRQARADIHALTVELDGFAYSISHDLRAPLRAIDGFSKILIEDHLSGLNDEGQRFLRYVH